MKKKILKYAGALIVIALLIVLDQWTKHWATVNLKFQPDIILIKGVFQLHYLENAGMAFGLLQHQQLLFSVMTVIILIFVIYLFVRTPEKKRYIPIYMILVLVCAGAVGNTIDRVSRKYVVDFLYFSLINFPVFNVADCYVTIAGILAAIYVLFVYKDEEMSALYSLKKEKKTPGGSDEQGN